TGTATLSMGDFSTLFLHRINNFMPAPGDIVTIITAGGGVINQFDNVTNDFPGLIRPTVIYNPNDVEVQFVLSPTPTLSQPTNKQKPPTLTPYLSPADM